MKKFLIFFIFLSCFFVLISSVSAADYHVKSSTTHKNIADWIKKDAKSGNDLVFDVSKYDLSDTLVINKAINIKSYKYTQINFNKNKDMFKVTSNGVTFSGLILNFNGQGTSINNHVSAISASGGYKKIDIKYTKINVNKKYATGINIDKWYGSAAKTNLKVLGYNSYGIDSSSWIGNLLYSNVYSYGDDSLSVYSQSWKGKIYGCKLYNYGKWIESSPSSLILVFSKGYVYNCIIKSSNGYPLMLSQEVKCVKCSVSAKKGYPKLYRYLPDLSIKNVKRVGTSYYLTISNSGLGSSKSCYLALKIGSSIKKTVVSGVNPGSYITVKVTLPSKYISKKYTKTVKIDYYNKIKEGNEKNNIKSFV